MNTISDSAITTMKERVDALNLIIDEAEFAIDRGREDLLGAATSDPRDIPALTKAISDNLAAKAAACMELTTLCSIAEGIVEDAPEDITGRAIDLCAEAMERFFEAADRCSKYADDPFFKKVEETEYDRAWTAIKFTAKLTGLDINLLYSRVIDRASEMSREEGR